MTAGAKLEQQKEEKNSKIQENSEEESDGGLILESDTVLGTFSDMGFSQNIKVENRENETGNKDNVTKVLLEPGFQPSSKPIKFHRTWTDGLEIRLETIASRKATQPRPKADQRRLKKASKKSNSHENSAAFLILLFYPYFSD
ncbi:hypothetical protein JTB14_028063 [Gonioctena quinquepunctata]|nr:hypothetical protein JTB14_028063 [Gonioctena quinquepunctata]